MYWVRIIQYYWVMVSSTEESEGEIRFEGTKNQQEL